MCLVSQRDHVPAAMVVAGCAGMLARRGRRVLVGQTHEQLFGLVFGLRGYREGDQSKVLVKTEVGAWIAREPLIGKMRPGMFRDPELRRRWDARCDDADVVLVHVNADGDGAWGTDGPRLDELVLLAGEASYESVIHAYQAVKHAVARNPHASIWVMFLKSDETDNARWLNLVQAADTFMGKPCALIGPVARVEELTDAFLSDRQWDRGQDLLGSLVAPLVDRWTQGVPPTKGARRVQGVSAPSAGGEMSGGADPCR
ncbi:MAG: hypothetical protein ACOYXU_00395 [Nitrospirota bacterium]